MQKIRSLAPLAMFLFVTFSINTQAQDPEALIKPDSDEALVVSLLSEIDQGTPVNPTKTVKRSDDDEDKDDDKKDPVFPFTLDVTVPLVIYMGLYFVWVDQVNRYIKDQAGTDTFLGRHNEACSETLKAVSGLFLLDRFKAQVKLIEGYTYKKLLRPIARFIKKHLVSADSSKSMEPVDSDSLDNLESTAAAA